MPSQVFIRGWSNWGDTNGITKTRATEMWNDIKKHLSVEDQRLVINWTVFDPIQRIAIHVMEQPGVAIHIRGRIQQIVSDSGHAAGWEGAPDCDPEAALGQENERAA